jgi:hypothetical protein
MRAHVYTRSPGFFRLHVYEPHKSLICLEIFMEDV